MVTGILHALDVEGHHNDFSRAQDLRSIANTMLYLTRDGNPGAESDRSGPQEASFSPVQTSVLDAPLR